MIAFVHLAGAYVLPASVREQVSAHATYTVAFLNDAFSHYSFPDRDATTAVPDYLQTIFQAYKAGTVSDVDKDTFDSFLLNSDEAKELF